MLGNQFAKQLSPIGIVKVDERGKDVTVKIAGIAQMDYLVLYKKFTYNEESSYKLEQSVKKSWDVENIVMKGHWMICIIIIPTGLLNIT